MHRIFRILIPRFAALVQIHMRVVPQRKLSANNFFDLSNKFE